jgi:hypothetical protein
MARRWTQGDGEERGQWGSPADLFSVRSDTPSELRRLVGFSLLTMGAVLVLLGSQAPFMALGFGLVFALFALQAAIQVPAARRAAGHQKGRSR